MPTSRGRACAIAVVAFAALAGGCSPQVQNTAAEVITMTGPQMSPGQQPVPAADPILTIVDGTDRLQFDLTSLERLGTAESRIYEPYVKQDVTFEGVPARDLMAYLGLRLDDRIHIVALDGVDVDVRVGDLIASKALLATRNGGTPIDIADGGPTRLVFPGAPLAEDLDRWIWSIDTLTIVRG